MSADLLFISLLCLFVLVLLVPTQWRSGLPMIYIMIELIVMNLVHVISESINENGSSKWFNISAHVDFASLIAMPICSICIIMDHAWSSAASSTLLNLKTLLNAIACVGIPVIYAFLYPVVQSSGSANAVFTVGQASFSLSSTSVILAGVVPLIICAGCLILAVLSTAQSLIFRSASRTLTTRALQPLLIAGLVSVVMIILSGLSTSSLMPSSGAELVTIDPSPLDRVAATARWWAAPAISLAIYLVLGLDMNTWRSYVEIAQYFHHNRVVANRRVSTLPMVSTSSKASLVHPLQSGWDDSFRPLPSPKASFRRPALHVDCTITTPSMLKSKNSPTSSSHHSPSSSNPDSSFAESTLTYLSSPTGRRALEAFSFSSPSSSDHALSMPPPCLVIPPTPTLSASSSSSPPPPSSYTVLRKSSDGALSTISTLAGSLLAPNAWPSPPAQLPPALDVIAPFSRYQPGDALPLPTADAPRRIEVGEFPVSISPPTSPTKARIAGSLKRVGSLGSMKRMRRAPVDGVRMEVVREVREMV